MEQDRPLREAPLTEDMLKAYSICRLKLEKLEGNYIETYGKTEQDISLEASEWARNTVFDDKEPLPGIDPRTGAYGADYASMGFYSAGMDYSDRGEHKKAAANFTKAIGINPRNIYAYHARGITRISLGEYQPALEDFTNAVELNPVMLARNNGQSRALVETLDTDTRCRLEQTLAENLVNRGAAFQKTGNYDGALADFREAVDYTPDFAEAWSNIGWIYFLLDEYEVSIAHSTKAIELNPSLSKTYFHRAFALVRIDKFKEAIPDFDTGLAMQPGYANAHSLRGICYLALKDFQPALTDLDEALRLNPDDGQAYYHRALTYYQLGERDKAFADYKEAVRYDSSYKSAKVLFE
ncbi:MAG: tetratricopeptide repeat protein [Treponema sp.]|jgi:tetratricopeptide (TPR) repeat protein|nr:tetratricopeptide repeat protein [Treponema sp.]